MNFLISKVYNILKKGRVTWLFLRLERKYLRGRKFDIFLRALNVKIMSNYGVLLTPNFNDSTFKLYVNGGYGFYFSAYLQQQVDPFVFLDIGANQGLYSIIASQNANCVKVVAFEPVRRTYCLLEKNIKINNAEKTILCLNKGLGEDTGMKTIRVPTHHSGRATLVDQVGVGIEGHSEEIVAIDGGEILDNLEIPTNCNAICKIDVEGAELSVVKEIFKSQVSGQINSIFYEVDERWICREEIDGFLASKGFTYFKKIGHGRHYDVLASRASSF